MFDSDLTVLTKVLHVKPEKIKSKGIKSVKSRVTNVKDYLKTDVTVREFKELLFKYVFEGEGNELREYQLTPEDMANIMGREMKSIPHGTGITAMLLNSI